MFEEENEVGPRGAKMVKQILASIGRVLIARRR
jgi:hypothetical protein